MNNIYFYDRKTKEYLYPKEVNEAYGIAIPNTTNKKILIFKDGFSICFDEKSEKWKYVEDNRGKTVYDISTKQELKVDYLGAIKTGYTVLKPMQFDKWDETLKSWVEDVDAVKKYERNNAKQQKEKNLDELVIDHHTVLYDANQNAIGNMGMVIAIANATFNKSISVGIDGAVMTLKDAYNYVYKEQTVTWKGSDNKPHKIQLESLVEASQKAMTKKAEILFKY